MNAKNLVFLLVFGVSLINISQILAQEEDDCSDCVDYNDPAVQAQLSRELGATIVDQNAEIIKAQIEKANEPPPVPILDNKESGRVGSPKAVLQQSFQSSHDAPALSQSIPLEAEGAKYKKINLRDFSDDPGESSPKRQEPKKSLIPLTLKFVGKKDFYINGTVSGGVKSISASACSGSNINVAKLATDNGVFRFYLGNDAGMESCFFSINGGGSKFKFFKIAGDEYLGVAAISGNVDMSKINPASIKKFFEMLDDISQRKMISIGNVIYLQNEFSIESQK